MGFNIVDDDTIEDIPMRNSINKMKKSKGEKR